MGNQLGMSVWYRCMCEWVVAFSELQVATQSDHCLYLRREDVERVEAVKDHSGWNKIGLCLKSGYEFSCEIFCHQGTKHTKFPQRIQSAGLNLHFLRGTFVLLVP